MLKVLNFKCENCIDGCVTDSPNPKFSFCVESDNSGAEIKNATISVNGEKLVCDSQINVEYSGKPLSPFSRYTATLSVLDNFGETAEKTLEFSTGRMGLKWSAKWITDGEYVFKEKKVSPVPMTFCRKFGLSGKVKRAYVCATALGVYFMKLNGKNVGEEYFAPGFTSYKSCLQYQFYDISGLLANENEIIAVVAGGWAVGSFVFTRANRITAPRQAFSAEIYLEYENGEKEIISTDGKWRVTREGNYRAADFYDGEVYDASIDLNKVNWHPAAVEKVKISPEITLSEGAPVVRHEKFAGKLIGEINGEYIYDFSQNFAGVVELKIKGRKGQEIVVTHAEVLNADGSLNRKILRSAKAEARYTCRDGEQVYSPRLTYMGFRYAAIAGISPQDLEVNAYALYSDLPVTGTFECSDENINKLNSNIVWGAKSNFVDIPTDCPQRDERMGWTGDIALFAPTACYNFDLSRFLNKWLKSMRAEQKKSGGIPNTIPSQSYGFPTTMPVMAVEFWGDACVLVPWAEYLARGDISVLKENYPMMKKYFKACLFWAKFLSAGKRRYIWHTPAILHFGDWVAPDEVKMSAWQKRSVYTATASLKNTSAHLRKIALLLGESSDAEYYEKIGEKVKKAFCSVLTDGNGKCKKQFQTAYVLPLQFKIFEGESAERAADILETMIKDNGYCIGTGFPGTPYVLFALADNGKIETAFRMLKNTKCPSWLYEVGKGATTVWERWDGLDENGLCQVANDGTGGMISFNHYASGAVGSFLYQRILGVEPCSGGYKTFRVKPVLGGDITRAKGEILTPYGYIKVEWNVSGGNFEINVNVPVGTSCSVNLPDGSAREIRSGKYIFECSVA